MDSTASSRDVSPKPRRRQRRPPKEAVVTEVAAPFIDLSLYIDGVTYTYGCICAFCDKERAEYHCIQCKEFQCGPCELEIHSYGKRMGHVRSKLSKYDMQTAAKMITHAVRYHGHLITLQRKCRAVFRRYFNSKAWLHYYYNPIYNTTSWRKPYCLRKLELYPFLTEDGAAARIQGLYRAWAARVYTLQLLKYYYTKLYDRRKGEFYYSYDGKSKILPLQNWQKPLLLTKRGFPSDLKPLYTEDVAAMRIQQRWRHYLVPPSSNCRPI